MKLIEIKPILSKHPEAAVRFLLPNDTLIPAHAHVTEAARIDKRFIDCGGKYREESLCRLQTWVADDLNHRLTAVKLARILEKAEPVLRLENLEVDVEYEAGFISQFPVDSVQVKGNEVILRLGERHTACLAQEQCCPTPDRHFVNFPSLNIAIGKS